VTLERRARAAAQAERALVDRAWPPPPWQRVLARRRRRSLAATGAALLAVAALVWVVVRPALQEQPVVRPVPSLPTPGRVTTTVPVGESPAAVAAGDGVVWVGTSGNGTVARVDPASGRVTATLRLGGRVDGLVQAYGALWVAYADRAVVTRVDPATATVVGEVPVGRHALGGDASTFRLAESIGVGLGAVWVPNSADGTVSRIDPASGVVTATFPVSVRIGLTHLDHAGVGVAVAGGAVWVTDEYHDRLLRLDPRTGRVAQTVALTGDPLHIRADGGRLWVATAGGQKLYGLDPATGRVTSRISLGPGIADPGSGAPATLALAVEGQTAWAASAIHGRPALVRVDLRTGRVTGELPLRGRVLGMALVDGHPWLADYDTNTVLHVIPSP
jgi:DNA-binding beta-propeller fold protein YncE